jgi:hypothetical protein
MSADRILRAAPALVLLGVMSCAPHSASREPAESHMAKQTIQDVLKKNTDDLMSIPGVQGVAVGERGGRPCILVLVVKKTSEIMTKIPSELEGFPVVVEETGAIRRLGAKTAIHQR